MHGVVVCQMAAAFRRPTFIHGSKEPVMDGDIRYSRIRAHIAAQHDIARQEREGRTARVAGARREAKTAAAGWSSGLNAVVGTLTSPANRKPASA
jgi:hypothetical protein